MRAQAKLARLEEEEESAFVSMTDMTVGFLFIMMILLAFFASQIRDQDAVSRDEYNRVVADRDDWRVLADDREIRIAELEDVNAALDRRIAFLEDELARLRQTLARVQSDLNSVTAERDRLTSALAQADLRIATLEDEVAELRALLARMQTELDDVTKERDAAQQSLSEAEVLVADLENRLASALERIAELEARLAELTAIDPLEAYLAQVAQARQVVLRRLRDAIRADFPDLAVELSEESDALRFQGEGLFASGSPNLRQDKSAVVASLARRLDQVLPCFTVGPSSRFETSCNPAFVMIEAVQIEGHTDNVGNDRYNRTLSASRANNTFFAMTDAAPTLMEHQNIKRQPVLSVAAYGFDRPIVPNDTPEGRSTNRRIDLRFIMVTPQDTAGIEVIRQALRQLSEQP